MLTAEQEAERGRGSLPVGLHYWFTAHMPEEQYAYASAAKDQIVFVRDELVHNALWGVLNHPCTGDYDRDIDLNTCKVVSTHRSKSVVLPVYRIDFLPETTLTLRGNFYNWKISVESLYPIKLDSVGVFRPSGQHSSVYCEGFKDEWVFGAYAEDQCRFTIEVPDKYQVWFVLRQIANSLMEKHPLERLAEQAAE